MSLTHEQRERDRKSLQDLARLAQMTPAPSSVRMPVASPANMTPAPAQSRPSNDDMMSPSSRREEDSGLVNFAAFSPQPPTSALAMDQVMGPAISAPISSPPGRISTPAASTGLFDDEPLSGHPPSVAPPSYAPTSGHHSVPAGFLATLPSGGVPQLTDSVRPPVSYAVPQSAAPQSAAPQSLHAQPAKKKSGAAIYVIGTFVALAAVAAGGFLVVRPMIIKRAQNAQMAMNAAKVETTKEAPAPVVSETRWQDQIAAATPAADPAPAVELADTTPAAANQKPDLKVAAVTSPSYAKKAPTKDNKNAAAFALNDEPKPAPVAPAPPPPAVKAAAPTGSGDANLDNAMKTAAGPSDSTNVQTADDRKPAFAAGTVPQRPSQGAVTGAIGAVLPNARACLGADDAVSRATIVFAGAGNVTSVSVHGGAAGKPAEQCIKGALSAAKVPPFAESTYTANVTVRH